MATPGNRHSWHKGQGKGQACPERGIGQGTGITNPTTGDRHGHPGPPAHTPGDQPLTPAPLGEGAQPNPRGSSTRGPSPTRAAAMSEQCPGLSPERGSRSTRGTGGSRCPSEGALLAGPAQAPRAAPLQPPCGQETAQRRRGAQVPAALQVDSFVGPLCTPGNLQPTGRGCSSRDGSSAHGILLRSPPCPQPSVLHSTRGRRGEVTGMAEAGITRPRWHLGQARSRQGLPRTRVPRQAELWGCPSSFLPAQ